MADEVVANSNKLGRLVRPPVHLSNCRVSLRGGLGMNSNPRQERELGLRSWHAATWPEDSSAV